MAGGKVKPPGAVKWLVCGLLLLATVLNYLDRQVLSLTAEKIISEFHTYKAGFGELIAAFRFSYAAVQFLCGWLTGSSSARVRAICWWEFSCAGP
jgi:ACS family hexuronate transporter-like MFS transporter